MNSYNKQISLNVNLINFFNESLSSIEHNQDTIVNNIKDLFNKTERLYFDLDHYIRLKNVLDQIEINLNTLIYFLTDIENAITFAKLETLHHSILKLNEIQIIINKLSETYNNKQLIFHEENDLYNYYNLIKVKSYYSNARLVFVLEIPIVNPNSFNYYHLYSIPTLNYTTLIPENPYLATYEGLYQYQSQECPFINSVYYCDDAQLYQLNQQQDCITSILNQSAKSQCQYTKLSINSNLVEPINSKYYILIFQSESEIQINCNKKDIMNLKDTHLIELPLGCSFTHNFIKFANEKGYIDSQPLLLSRITVPQIETQQEDILEIKLAKIPLDKLAQMKNNQHKLEINHNTIEYLNNHYIIISIIIMLIIIVLFIHKYLQTCNNCKKTDLKKEENQQPTEDREAGEKTKFQMKILPNNQ